jgi:AAA family ATP:ADP antiporter
MSRIALLPLALAAPGAQLFQPGSTAVHLDTPKLWTPANPVPQATAATQRQPAMIIDGPATAAARDPDFVPADPEILGNDALMFTAALLLAGTAGYEYYHYKQAPSEGRVALLAAAGAEASEEGKFLGMTGKEAKKIVPLGMMFFCILFNYTILRDTKDVLVVTAPGAGAEIIPFLKTYVQLPGAIIFSAFYATLCNKFEQGQIVIGVVTSFLAFYVAFAWILYPNIATLHPTAFCTMLAANTPQALNAPIALFRNWTFTLFYLFAELWGSVVLSLLFWGFANQVTKVAEAKKYYPLFGLFANIALICSGTFVKYVSKLRGSLPPGVDPWGYSLKLLMGGLTISGAILLSCFIFLQKKVVTDPECVDPNEVKKSKTKTKMTLRESVDFLAKSSYIRNLAMLVIGYGMSINLVEVTWKSKLKQQFPDPNQYSVFMGNFSACTGATTIVMMLVGRQILQRFGWGAAALVTPSMMLGTGVVFFSLILQPGAWTPITAIFGMTPLMLAVIVGAAQNVFTKSAKYGMFDPCKEIAYIPLDQEQKTKGKAAIDVIGNPLGKSGGAFIQQFLIVSCGSLAASAPYLAVLLGLIVVGWIQAARSLAVQFAEINEEQDAAKKDAEQGDGTEMTAKPA